MPRNYYVTLGIEREANLSEIKRAYRRAMKRYHPDATGKGPADPDKLMEARNAYEVLSNREKRRAYDAELNYPYRPVRIRKVKDIKNRGSIWGRMKGFQPWLDNFSDEILPGYYRRRTGRSPISKELYLEVILTPMEAQAGGLFPVKVPIVEACPGCDPTAWCSDFYCLACLGYGVVRSYCEFNLNIPPNTQHETTAEVPMDALGYSDVRLYLDIKIRNNPL
jgi:DnaJ-class molecular chaperone